MYRKHRGVRGRSKRIYFYFLFFVFLFICYLFLYFALFNLRKVIRSLLGSEPLIHATIRSGRVFSYPILDVDVMYHHLSKVGQCSPSYIAYSIILYACCPSLH